MNMDPFNLKSLQKLLDDNKGFIDKFFGQNPFDESFFKQVSQNSQGTEELKINDTSDMHSKSSAREVAVDMINRGYELLLVFEIPGLINKDDVNIKVIGSSLILEGEIKRPYVISSEDKTKFERHVGPFYKKISIPVNYDSKRIRAKYNNGLLEIRFPVLRQNVNEKINVQFPQID